MDGQPLSALRDLFGERLFTSREQRICYSYDATGTMSLPDAVAFPVSAEEVRRTVLLANEHRFPVIPRGAGSGFSGGSVPVHGGLVLSLERMDRIPSIDQRTLGTGELIRTGVYTVKGVVGYDLTRLLVGSEGTLGIVTKAILKLIPFPETRATILAFFRSNHDGSSAVAGIIRERITPCAMELMDRTAIGWGRREGGRA